MEDTIAAISTSLGVGAISIIRLSGSQSIPIVNSIFHGKNLNKVVTHTINYGYIEDNNIKIDEVLISVMRAPKTFTKEDVVEINCHGGIATTKRVLELLLEHGCRLAQPGEFTKRAFLNGRIDLVEAEGIMNLIEAKTEQSRGLALKQMGGQTSNMIKELKAQILKIMASIEVNIDYPEYEDIEKVTFDQISSFIIDIKIKLEKLLLACQNSRLIKEGIETIIIGRPNVGKSSILNTLIDEEKAIVTDIAGTTRDIVEGQINIDGFILNIMDTAGIRATSNQVEAIGVKKSLSLMESADLILFILNNNEELTEEDLTILDKIKNKNYIIVINKIDLNKKINTELLKGPIVYLSAIENIGFEDLKKEIKSILNLDKIDLQDLTYLTNAESISLIRNSLKTLTSIEEAIKNNVSLDLIEMDIRSIYDDLSKILGETYDEDIIDALFKNFCLGK